jgi:hypothetical protein
LEAKSLNFSNEKKITIWLDRIIAIGILFFLIGLSFHLVIKGIIPDPLGTYWKEILLGLLVVLWAVRCVLARRLLITKIILTPAILLYAALILRFLLDGATLVSWWGLYISIMYLPLVFLVPVVLNRYPQSIMTLFGILAALGGVIALGGIIEFLINRPLWPSAELITRQGFSDVYIYGTHLRRVYFVFDSPTSLANTLALLLPLALVLMFSARRSVARIAAGFTAALIFICILFTFSRGIWVAIVLSGIIIAACKFFLEGNRKFILAGLGTVMAGAVIFLIIVLIRPITTPAADNFTVELAADRYEQVPLTGAPLNLFSVAPQKGSLEFQNWTLYDAIRQNQDTRIVLYSPPKNGSNAEMIFRVTVPDSGALKFSIALNPDVWTPEKGDGVNFWVYINDISVSQSGETVFQRYINPKSNPTDRRWRNYVVDLSKWSGKSVDLYLITEAGPQNDSSFDWAGWGEIQLVSIPHSLIEENIQPASNTVIDHLASVADWNSDETNRDRLTAWNIALKVWGQSPLWGKGLGTSGVAALRTSPESAFVTESQPLKAIVELGLPGILVWGYLWFIIFRTALSLYRNERRSDKRILILGILSSLLIVFIDGLVYQNLEVKQVNAFFWTLVGVLAFFSFSANRSEEV